MERDACEQSLDEMYIGQGSLGVTWAFHSSQMTRLKHLLAVVNLPRSLDATLLTESPRWPSYSEASLSTRSRVFFRLRMSHRSCSRVRGGASLR
jgi:hypothetical protein